MAVRRRILKCIPDPDTPVVAQRLEHPQANLPERPLEHPEANLPEPPRERGPLVVAIGLLIVGAFVLALALLDRPPPRRRRIGRRRTTGDHGAVTDARRVGHRGPEPHGNAGGSGADRRGPAGGRAAS
ncbi:MAG TPA: hypothetical protein VG165_17890 [Solirubrobacteraceae bacterium]|nr:hypothetical protein [Solirubrobacteraceae bacterium]